MTGSVDILWLILEKIIKKIPVTVPKKAQLLNVFRIIYQMFFRSCEEKGEEPKGDRKWRNVGHQSGWDIKVLILATGREEGGTERVMGHNGSVFSLLEKGGESWAGH